MTGGVLTPAQERQRVRLEEWCAREEISWLRKMGMNEQADAWEGEGHRPGISPLWLRDHVRQRQRERELTYNRAHPERRQKYKRAHPEKLRASKRSTNANWREKHAPNLTGCAWNGPWWRLILKDRITPAIRSF
jgi:hypothetical protein